MIEPRFNNYETNIWDYYYIFREEKKINKTSFGYDITYVQNNYLSKAKVGTHFFFYLHSSIYFGK